MKCVDKNSNDIKVLDILFAVKGISLKHYIIVEIAEVCKCQEVDSDFNIIKQPKGKKFTELKPHECLLHSRRVGDKYLKVL